MAQIDALPYAALLGYAEALGVMKLALWNGQPLNEANPDGAVRQLIFGPGGYGLVTYLVLEDQQRWTCSKCCGPGSELRTVDLSWRESGRRGDLTSHLWPGQWAIKTPDPLVRDVTFCEDASQARLAPESGPRLPPP
jgi:hypothetical protein